MKNGQKYAKEIQRMVNQEYFECSLWNIRNGKRASEDCCHIPKSFDPVSGSDEFCKKCLCESLEWLNQEYKDPILDDVEREYLSAVIKPFRNKVKNIVKISGIGKSKEQYIRIVLGELDFMNFPNFNKNTGMYKGMEADRLYNLEELGL